MTDEEVETVIETLGLGDGEPDKLADVDDQLEMLEAGRPTRFWSRSLKILERCSQL
ncbi:hypothetical protein HT576_05285 [Haloterrigena sp. SYSU A121-1]|uniref:Uncharacterized protein n=1 Tax=Haloterrigena gelatinilytica TaxID=2741724 RepID=A0A8J8KEX9_9EURY|nr:hypothetical protein [Haloterrigena gelatinilytica]NUB90447.1 hypothetical protein [Haloterrigena gelatinilytica]